MGTTLKKRVLKPPVVGKADRIAAEAATVFVRAGIERKQAEAEHAQAKAVLTKWLGDDSAKRLPDGRTVTRSSLDFDAIKIDRPAYTQVVIKVIAAE